MCYDMKEPREEPMSYLERLEVIEFIVTEVNRETQGDFEEDMLRDQLETWTDMEVETEGRCYGWM